MPLMNPRTVATLPRWPNRDSLGSVLVVDEDEAVIFGEVPCLGCSDRWQAIKAGNPDRNPLKTDGDTPCGLYVITVLPLLRPTAAQIRSFGRTPRLLLVPLSGDCLRAKREGIMQHEGALEPSYTQWGGLRPTFGCIRVAPENQVAMVNLVQQHKGPFYYEVTERTA